MSRNVTEYRLTVSLGMESRSIVVDVEQEDLEGLTAIQRDGYIGQLCTDFGIESLTYEWENLGQGKK